uniref:Zn(2)-C6 fungal-type domain-containing protein n=1 Tax=Bionectria ochroleuca TaxID=29856 RepID=A0A8H7N104_BIOOC
MGPFNEQAEQPSKRPRTESAGRTDDMRSAEADSEPVADEPHTARGPRRQRTRAAMACAVCRARKTKCDGRRPSCGFCQRTSSACQYDTVVEYAPDSAFSGHQDMGPQILQAIEQLTQLVKTQQSQSQPEWANYYRGPTQSCSPPRWWRWTALWTSFSIPSLRLLGRPRQRAPMARLSPGIDKIPVDNGIPIPMPDELPPLSLMELTRLQMNYRRVVHDFNPMLDLATLDRYTTHIAENGLDFTTRTCLVVLVCAVGALCQEESAFTIPSRLPVTERNDDLDIAYRFWSVASRRLGRAMSHNTLESAQCLCLAGIWFMCNLQPLDAWKHFTMAGNCYYSAILARKSLASPGSQSPQLFPQAIEHSIFYTAYKSELEIRYELAIPGSVLEHLEEELVFPSPPMLSETQLEGPNDEAITWYYYLTDIAARHLINRIINTGFKIGGCPTEAQARSLLRDYKIFGSQLEDWYESLPK